MKKIALAMLFLASACSKADPAPSQEKAPLPRIITDQQYQLLSDTDKARYERFFDEWARILVPGDPGYVETHIEMTPEFVDAMNEGMAARYRGVHLYNYPANIFRNRVNDKLKQAGPVDDPVKK